MFKALSTVKYLIQLNVLSWNGSAAPFSPDNSHCWCEFCTDVRNATLKAVKPVLCRSCVGFWHKQQQRKWRKSINFISLWFLYPTLMFYHLVDWASWWMSEFLVWSAWLTPLDFVESSKKVSRWTLSSDSFFKSQLVFSQKIILGSTQTEE